jgi:DNA-binding PadR family transcriptional regulator
MMCGDHMRFRGYPRWEGMMSWPGRFFGPGEVRLALLSLVAEGPSHGYELMKKLEERSGGVYRASAGTVYPTLQQLEDEGLITSGLQDGRRVYRLTDAGLKELERREEDVSQIWRRARRWGDWRSAFDPSAAEIWGPAERLIKAAFKAVAGELNETRIENIRKILERALREIQDEFAHKQ